MAFAKGYYTKKFFSLVDFSAGESDKTMVTLLKGIRIGRLGIVWFVLDEHKPRPTGQGKGE
jgi:hypothetical protein